MSSVWGVEKGDWLRATTDFNPPRNPDGSVPVPSFHGEYEQPALARKRGAAWGLFLAGLQLGPLKRGDRVAPMILRSWPVTEETCFAKSSVLLQQQEVPCWQDSPVPSAQALLSLHRKATIGVLDFITSSPLLPKRLYLGCRRSLRIHYFLQLFVRRRRLDPCRCCGLCMRYPCAST